MKTLVKKISAPIKYHGGKSYLADWIISHFPPRSEWNLYREPYFGAGNVLLRVDPEGISEAVNDLDLQLTDFWRVLANPIQFREFQRIIEATPFSEYEFKLSLGDGEFHTGQVSAAAAFFVKARQSRQGLMRDFATPTTRTRRGMNENVSAWLSAVEGLSDVHDRIKRVEIRTMDGVEFIRKYDHPKALFYCDPPYLHETRTVTDAYRHEMSNEQHGHLLCALRDMKGKFILSGYDSQFYREFAAWPAWRCVHKPIDNKAASGSSKRTMVECLWMNY